MSRIVWQSKVEATNGHARLVEVEYESNKCPQKDPAFILESSRTKDALGQNIWLPVDICAFATNASTTDAEAIKTALAALGELAVKHCTVEVVEWASVKSTG